MSLRLVHNARPGLLQHVQRAWLKAHYVARLVKTIRPDVAVGFTSAGLIVALDKLVGLRVPVVTVIQNFASRVNREKHRRLHRAFTGLALSHADGVVAISEGVKMDLVTHYGLDSSRITVVSNPVDVGRIEESAREPIEDAAWPAGVPIVLNVGRLAPQKNQALLLRAFRRVRQQTGAHLAILGTGRLQAELQAFVDELDLDGSVHFLGWRDNPFKYMRQSSVFVLSSDYEGLGNVLLEALAVGCPVVSTDCPYGPSEVLGEGRYGLLAPVGDESALADAILRVLTDERLRLELVERGRERVQDFDVAKIAARYEAVLRGVVDRNAAKSGRVISRHNL